MAGITVKQAVGTFIAIRAEIAKRDAALKKWKAEQKVSLDKLEKFIRKNLKVLDITSIGAESGTAFESEKDFVSIADKDEFKKFLVTQMLLSFQSHMYKTTDGEWQPGGEQDLNDYVQHIADSGTFDLLTLSANKTNCKTYMEKNKGLMPAGIKYVKETSLQVRKGK